MVLRIRAASVDDVEVIARIQLHARRAAGDRFPPSMHEDAELVPPLLRDVLPTEEAWLAERDGEPVGVAVLEGDLLDGLYVLPGAQGTGMGGARGGGARRAPGLARERLTGRSGRDGPPMTPGEARNRPSRRCRSGSRAAGGGTQRVRYP